MSTPGYLSNAELAAQLSVVVDRWNLRENQMIALISQPDGTVIVTDGLGNNHELSSFPELQKQTASLIAQLDSGIADIANVQVIADAAAASATTAQTAANTATSAKDAAQAAQTAATQSAAVANTSASQAASSATAANASKETAQAAQTTATAAAQTAQNAETSASASKDAATSSATAAAASQTAASASAANAADSASAAAASKTAAADSASAADTSATAASTDANTATSAKDAAQASATAAATSATNAADSATAASNSANVAVSAKADAEAARDAAAASAANVNDILESAGNVVSVAGKTGAVSLTADDIESGTFAAPRIPKLAISKVTGLQTALDGKLPASYAPAWGDVTDKPGAFTPVAHQHPISDVQNLQSLLDNKASLNNPVFNSRAFVKASSSDPRPSFGFNAQDGTRRALLYWNVDNESVHFRRFGGDGASPQGEILINANGHVSISHPLTAPVFTGEVRATKFTDPHRAQRYFFNQL